MGAGRRPWGGLLPPARSHQNRWLIAPCARPLLEHRTALSSIVASPPTLEACALDVLAKIRDLDRNGYHVLDALSHDGRRSETLSHTCVFTCVDGKGYWVKAEAQQGLVAELIAGRLAALTHAGPAVRIIRVTAEAMSPGDECNHLVGVVFGSEDMPSTENSKDLGKLIADGSLDPSTINHLARARVVAFQTWLGIGDAQVLVRLTDGQLFSLDHGEAFGTASDRSDPVPVVADIPGIDESVGRKRGHVIQAVAEIERISDAQIVAFAAQIPSGDPWRSPAERRTTIVEYLIHRRGKLQEVMTKWASA